MFHGRMRYIEKYNQSILPHPYCITLEVKPNGENASDIITGCLFQGLRVPLPKFFSATSRKRQNTGTQRFSHYLKTYLFGASTPTSFQLYLRLSQRCKKRVAWLDLLVLFFTSYAKAFYTNVRRFQAYSALELLCTLFAF